MAQAEFEIEKAAFAALFALKDCLSMLFGIPFSLEKGIRRNNSAQEKEI